MATDDLFLEFITKLKKEKSPEEVGKFVANLMKFGAAELYMAMMMVLTEQDLQAIEAIEDEAEAEKQINERFKAKTGMMPVDFVNKLRDKIATGYLFPELIPKKKR